MKKQITVETAEIIETAVLIKQQRWAKVYIVFVVVITRPTEPKLNEQIRPPPYV